MFVSNAALLPEDWQATEVKHLLAKMKAHAGAGDGAESEMTDWQRFESDLWFIVYPLKWTLYLGLFAIGVTILVVLVRACVRAVLYLL